MKFLVVVDMQNDFVDGALGTKEAQNIVPKVVKKIHSFHGGIMYTQDTHDPNYLNTQEGRLLPIEHCVDGSDGWKLNSSVFDAIERRNQHDFPVEPFRKGTFGSVELADWLRDEEMICGVDEVVLIGLCTDICVISNALLIKAFLPGVKVTVDAACCAGVTPESHANALAAMKMCQINIENWEG